MKLLFGLVLSITIAIILQINNVQADNAVDAACAEQGESVVCGYNGKCFKTFKNLCYLVLEGCTKRRKFEKIADCACDDANIRASRSLCVCKNSYVPTPV